MHINNKYEAVCHTHPITATSFSFFKDKTHLVPNTPDYVAMLKNESNAVIICNRAKYGIRFQQSNVPHFWVRTLKDLGNKWQKNRSLNSETLDYASMMMLRRKSGEMIKPIRSDNDEHLESLTCFAL